MSQLIALHIQTAWICILCAILSGAVIGLGFHRENYLGGYNHFRRRLLRLGHISFFGLGSINWFFAFTLAEDFSPLANAELASPCLIIAAISMPLCCFLAAWKAPLRHTFPIPVLSLSAAVLFVL